MIIAGDVLLAFLCLAGLSAVASVLFFGAMGLGDWLDHRKRHGRKAGQRRYDERFDRIVRAESDRWADGMEAIPARACEPSDVTPDVPQGLYDGLPQDQITDEEREMP